MTEALASVAAAGVRRSRGGAMLWIDCALRRGTRNNCQIELAILRHDALVMDLVIDRDVYDLELRRQPDGAFKGTWRRNWVTAAPAACRLDCWETAPEYADNLVFDGTWTEGTEWKWIGRLESMACGSSEGA